MNNAIRTVLAIVMFAIAITKAHANDEWWDNQNANGGGDTVMLPPFVVNSSDSDTFDWGGYFLFEAALREQNDPYVSVLGTSYDIPEESGGGGGGEPYAAANPFENALKGLPITNATANQKFGDSLAIIESHDPALAKLIKDKVMNSELRVDHVARLALNYVNSQDSSKTEARGIAGVYDADKNRMAIVINSLTTSQQIAAVLIHELTHMKQDLVENKNANNTPFVDIEAPAWKAQYEFMKSQSMDMSLFTPYLDNGQWSDDKFKAAYTTLHISTDTGGTWQQTGTINYTPNTP